MSDMVDVLIPTYNNGDLLRRAVESILRQTYRRIRILIYDDGSVPSAKEGISGLLGANVLIRRNPVNHGRGYARQELLDWCTSDISCWQDADDYACQEKISHQLAYMLDHDSVFVSTLMMDISAGGKLRKGSTTAKDRMKLLSWCPEYRCRYMNVGTIMFRTSIAREIGFNRDTRRGPERAFYK